jgi:two-component system sensor histidine kinase RpfC
MNAIPSPKTAFAVPEEQSQAAVRLVMVGIGLAYAARYAMGRDDFTLVAILGEYLAVAIGIYAAIRLWPTPSIARRIFGMAVDAVAVSAALFLLGNGGVFLVGAYFFVILGNGFRFGRIYLHLSQLLCIAGFMSVFALVPWWRNEPVTFAGLLILLTVLPFYVSGLAERIKAARQEAEQALKECLNREEQMKAALAKAEQALKECLEREGQSG